jgi:hypothetical protein
MHFGVTSFAHIHCWFYFDWRFSFSFLWNYGIAYGHVLRTSSCISEWLCRGPLKTHRIHENFEKHMAQTHVKNSNSLKLKIIFKKELFLLVQLSHLRGMWYINYQKNYGKKKSHSKGEEKAKIGTKVPNYLSINNKKDGWGSIIGWKVAFHSIKV